MEGTIEIPQSYIFIRYALFLTAIVYVIIFSVKEGKSIRDGLKGDDGKWQFIEVVAYVWLVIFASASMADVFLEVRASMHFWASLDAIFVTLVGGKIGTSYFGSKKENNSDTET